MRSATVEPDALQYLRACPRVPYGTRAPVYQVRTKRAHKRVLRVLSASTADSFTEQADMHYSMSLQYIGTVVIWLVIIYIKYERTNGRGGR